MGVGGGTPSHAHAVPAVPTLDLICNEWYHISMINCTHCNAPLQRTVFCNPSCRLKHHRASKAPETKRITTETISNKPETKRINKPTKDKDVLTQLPARCTAIVPSGEVCNEKQERHSYKTHDFTT